MLERAPDSSEGRDLGRMVHDWTGKETSSDLESRSGAGVPGSNGRSRLPGLDGGADLGGRGNRGGSPALSSGGDRKNRSEGTGKAPFEISPKQDAIPSSNGESGEAGQAGEGSRHSFNSMTGLSSSLLPSGSTGESSHSSNDSAAPPSESNGSSIPGVGSRGESRPSASASSGIGFGMISGSPSSGSSSNASSGTSGSSSSSSAGENADQPPLIPEQERKEPLRIEAAFEVVIACQRDGIEILPGGNRITMKTLQTKGTSGNGQPGQDLLIRHLRSLERKRAIVDPMIRPRPRVKFVVEAGGDDTYLAVRRQLLFSGLDWPMTVQLVEGQGSRFLSREVWR